MLIDVSTADAVGVMMLNQPAKRNALSTPLVDECLAALGDFERAGVRAVILRAAANARVWSAGHDISELEPNQDPLRYVDPLERLVRAIQTFPAPVIAMVHGSVWGGATELVLACDLLIGDDTCSFAITPAKLGLAYNTLGLAHLMRRLPLNLVRELLYTARPIGAQDALRRGVLNHLVPAADLEKFTHDLAQAIVAQSPAEIRTLKEQLRTLSESTGLTAADFERLEALRRSVYEGPQFAEGLAAFHEKRPPAFS